MSIPIQGTRVFRASRLRLATVALFLIAAAPGDTAPPTTPKPAAVLTLVNGGFVAGELKDVDRPEVLRWQADAFISPFEFDRKAVASIRFPDLAERPRPSGDYCFELAGGDVVYGGLVSLNDKTAVLAIPRFGQLHVPRSHLHRIQRWRDSADLIYLGPNGLNGWRELSTASKTWREEAGRLISNVDGAAVRNDVGLPTRATVEFEISWKNKPDFLFALGVDQDEKNLARAFRLEVWGDDLVIHREAEEEADVSSVAQLTTGAGRIHLQAYLDQEQGRILIFAPNGVRLADMKVPVAKPKTLPAIYLANIKGDVCLERLRIGRWNGEAPRETKGDQARVHRDDGSIVYGQTIKFDPASKEFVISQDSKEERVPEGKIVSVFLSFPTEEPVRSLGAVLHDGTRMSGEPSKVENGELWLTMPGIEETIRLPLTELSSLAVLRHESRPSDNRDGRFETEGTQLLGRLEEGQEQSGASCLVWHPLESATASALKPGTAGRIVYAELPPEPSATTRTTANQPQPQPGPGVVAGFLSAFSGNQPGLPAAKPRSLHLRTGDIVPCEVTKIDESGVSIRTPLSDSTFVPHDKIKVVELAPESVSSVKLTRSKRDRLLTLPRMQKDSPPSQLIRSKNGDYLRGRVLKMDDKTIQLEIRLETKEVPRNRVARIIWLHPDEIDGTKKSVNASASSERTAVQAIRNDGTRMTFFADRVDGKTLSGKSDVLGACRISLDEVDQLLIGGAIEKAAAQLAYQQWKLHNAPEPKFVQGDENSPEGGANAGTESPLVGKPAPDFTLDLLDGKKFHLADAKGKVVILDFWATWCGPCLQAMPQVERVAHEFEAQGVQLIGVNLQEESKTISSMLERQKLKLTVALDHDGVVAGKYAATAIPQTVVIDRNGAVARLFVGSSPHLEEQLRNAVRPLLTNSPAGETPKN